MTVTERERRRMELVDGGANRTDLCELLAMREYELDNLKEENAKLGMRVMSLESALEGMHLIREQDKNENAKLRKLVCDVHEAIRSDKAGMFHKLILASMEDDMRELGIEVFA